MKIVFTGGGSGGHFYSCIAIADSVRKLCKANKVIPPKMYFFSNNPYNEGILYDHEIKYMKVSAGKMRRYFSLLNFTDIFKTMWGVLSATFDLFDIYPDVVFGKGGYASFPTLFAARLLRIPVVVHESDSVPGRANRWAGKFATRIAVSYKEAAQYFDPDKIAYTGQPILSDKVQPITEGAHEFFEFEPSIPTIFIIGGSQGAEVINNIILDSLPELIKDYQIIHQVGSKNLEVIKESVDAILLENPLRDRYKPYGYMNSLEISMASGASNLVVSRAGSTIFEIAAWQKPSIIIPITDSNGDHQIKNAFAYASLGCASVIKEENLKPHIFTAEINRIVSNSDINKSMSERTKEFYKPGAADKIAEELLSIALGHEKLT